MGDFIYSIIDMLKSAFITPIIDFIIDELGYTMPIIKIGFGSVEWFAMELDLLLTIILGITLSTIILVFIFKLLKWLTRFGGRKKW